MANREIEEFMVSFCRHIVQCVKHTGAKGLSQQHGKIGTGSNAENPVSRLSCASQKTNADSHLAREERKP
jgi:hypothetical protein